MEDLVIVGGGMSGMVAAIVAARRGKEVLILERQDALGKKLLATGNGRCNLSNVVVSDRNYVCDQPEQLKGMLEYYKEKEEDFWRSIGLYTIEKNGYIYPLSNQAVSVVDCLVANLKKLNVRTILGATVTVATRRTDDFIIGYDKGEDKGNSVNAKALLLCCGGKAGVYNEEKNNGFGIAEKFGHSLEASYPALVQARTHMAMQSEIAGVRAHAKVTLTIDEGVVGSDTGELQITEKYLSGIPVFQLTRHYLGEALEKGKLCALHLDFMPDVSQEDLLEEVKERQKHLEYLTPAEAFAGMMPVKLVEHMVKQPGANDPEKLVSLMKDYTVRISELNGYDKAQVSTGGIPLSEISTHFESCRAKNLFITGEMLNVTGECGGYNLFFAAAGGYAVGEQV